MDFSQPWVKELELGNIFWRPRSRFSPVILEKKVLVIRQNYEKYEQTMNPRERRGLGNAQKFKFNACGALNIICVPIFLKMIALLLTY